MSNEKYTIIELPEDSIFLDLGSFYGRYTGTFFYYQQKKILPSSDFDVEGYSEYIFHLNKLDCKEVDEKGKLFPILMCHISKKGLPLPDEIVKEIRRNDNKIYFYSKGFADFALSIREPDTGLTSQDEDLIIKLFNNPWYDD